MKIKSDSKTATRRKFLLAAGATAAAGIAAPAVNAQQGPINFRFQSTWPSKDIFHEYALDFGKKVNDMTGGDLKIEVLPAGAVVPAFQLLDAVSKGVLDGGHGVLVYHYGKNTALALWGSGPAYGMDANMLLSWHKYGGGKQLLEKIFAQIGANVVSFPYAPLYSQPLGWFKKPIQSVDDFKGLKYRTVGISIDLFTAMGAAVNALPGGEIVAAMDRGPARRSRVQQRLLGSRARFRRRLQGLHAAELSSKLGTTRDQLQQRQAARSAAEDAGDHRERRRGRVTGYDVEGDRSQFAGLHHAPTQDKVRFFKTPDTVLAKQLDLYDDIAKKYVASNPLFKEIIESQLAFAKRATRWEQDFVTPRKMAFDHYWGPNAKSPI